MTIISAVITEAMIGSYSGDSSGIDGQAKITGFIAVHKNVVVGSNTEIHQEELDAVKNICSLKNEINWERAWRFQKVTEIDYWGINLKNNASRCRLL